MDFSVIIPTIGRETLARAVTSVLTQTTDRALQVVVVNDAGAPLAPAGWQKDPRVVLLETARVERSRARNAGAGAARGAYLVFLDDDDWLLPDALREFSRAPSGAPWVLGDCHLVNARGEVVTTLRFEGEGNCAVQALAGEWLPLQAMCVARELFSAVQGFRPITHGEDRELASRLALTADLTRVRVPVACVLRDPRTSSSTYNAAQTDKYWLARDALLDAPGAFARVDGSVPDAYWRGRMARLYLNAVVLNVKRKRFVPAGARLKDAVRALRAFDAVRHGAFWRGILQAHTSHAR